jgi:hypothetical protein
MAFANVADDQLLDQIPLEEIIGIEEMEVSSEENMSQHIESTIETTVNFTNAFQIRTKNEGYNGGRSYFLRAESEVDLAILIQGVAVAAKGAARKARARSTIQIAQDHARSLYNSSWFQGTAAFLIIAVGPALHASIPSDSPLLYMIKVL